MGLGIKQLGNRHTEFWVFALRAAPVLSGMDSRRCWKHAFEIVVLADGCMPVLGISVSHHDLLHSDLVTEKGSSTKTSLGL